MFQQNVGGIEDLLFCIRVIINDTIAVVLLEMLQPFHQALNSESRQVIIMNKESQIKM